MKFTFLILTLILLAFSLTGQEKKVFATNSYVTTNGMHMYLAGNLYTFLGVNRYNLLTIGGNPYIGCGTSWTQADLDQWFSEVNGMGANAVRFWAFQSFTATNGANLNYDRLDYIVNQLAPKYNIRVIPVLENQWVDCSQGGYKYDSWYQSGYLSPYGTYALSYKDYVNDLVSRYKNSPNILMWQLMNEAEDKNSDGTCASGTNLYNFASAMSTYIKSIDSNHLVSFGTGGGESCGISSNTYQTLHSLPSIDVVEAHDYRNETQALPGSPIQSNIAVQIFIQDKNWTWYSGSATQSALGKWTVVTYTIPSGVVTPLQRIGLNFYIPMAIGYSGPLYIDTVKIGSNSYTFEDGSTQGWSYAGSSSGILNSTTVAHDGSHSLQINVDLSINNGAMVYIPAPASAGAGTLIKGYLYTPKNAPYYSSIASDLQMAKNVNKPFFIGESGILSNCSNINCYTTSQRASFFNSKITTLFSKGGGGYLIWSYRDNTNLYPDYYAFNNVDPLYQLMQTLATTYIH